METSSSATGICMILRLQNFDGNATDQLSLHLTVVLESLAVNIIKQTQAQDGASKYFVKGTEANRYLTFSSQSSQRGK